MVRVSFNSIHFFISFEEIMIMIIIVIVIGVSI